MASEWRTDRFARATLADMLDFARMAADVVARGRQAYEDDITLRLAAEAICSRMGEAVARLTRTSPSLLVDYSDVDWAAIKGMRDVVAHQYGSLDHNIIWNALAVEFPVDAGRFQAMLSEIAPHTT